MDRNIRRFTRAVHLPSPVCGTSGIDGRRDYIRKLPQIGCPRWSGSTESGKVCLNGNPEERSPVRAAVDWARAGPKPKRSSSKPGGQAMNDTWT